MSRPLFILTLFSDLLSIIDATNRFCAKSQSGPDEYISVLRLDDNSMKELKFIWKT